MTTALEIAVELYPFEKGQLKAFADVTISLGPHDLTLCGCRIVQNGDQQPWVAFPTSSYHKDGQQKNKKVVECSRNLDRLIKEQILEAYEKRGKRINGTESHLVAM